MASPLVIQTGIGNRLRTIAGLHVYDQWPDAIAPQFPCAIVGNFTGAPEQTFGRGDLTRYDGQITIYMSLAPGKVHARTILDPFVATSSTGGVYGAIHADRTLGGVAHATFVKGTQQAEEVEIAPDYFVEGVTWQIECWAS